MKGDIFMPSGKKMYSTELKLKVVQRYLKGDVSIKDVAKEFNVDKSDVRKWRDAYIQNDIEGLYTTHGSYTGDFKISVVEYIHNTGASIRQAAAYFNIPSPPTISKWEHIYFEQGKEALYIDNRGRANKMKNTMKKESQKKNVQENEDLLTEVQRLRMENAYLKKLNALIHAREKSGKKTK